MKQSGQDKGTLLLALVAGLSINGTFAALFSSIVPFSVFPIIALVLAVYCLHQRYQNRTMPVGLPGWLPPVLSSACCCTAPWYVRNTRISVLTSSRRCCR
ncbi:Inner membrane protein yijD [Citrobacter koseri]|uniref:Inner membrane protein yijD n=1 Tax=Citrobacter koseri TaxID=545 RepID=A0A2X2WEJ8_CITKO|nr:Inner membrane protein yijD [Citrobacter koseri]